MKSEIRKRALASYLREGDDVSQRIDWSLIFHAILAEAFLNHTPEFGAALPVGLLGLVAAVVWLFTGRAPVPKPQPLPASCRLPGQLSEEKGGDS